MRLGSVQCLRLSRISSRKLHGSNWGVGGRSDPSEALFHLTHISPFSRNSDWLKTNQVASTQTASSITRAWRTCRSKWNVSIDVHGGRTCYHCSRLRDCMSPRASVSPSVLGRVGKEHSRPCTCCYCRYNMWVRQRMQS